MDEKLKQLQDHPEALISADARVQRDKRVLRVSRSMWLCPTMVILSIVAASLVTFVFPDIVVRPVLIMWFLFVCPGMTVVRFFPLSEVVIEWLLALALSIAIDASIAGILLYASWWSPIHIFIVLISFCLIGAMMQFIVIYRKQEKGADIARPVAGRRRIDAGSAHWHRQSLWPAGLPAVIWRFLAGPPVAKARGPPGPAAPRGWLHRVRAAHRGGVLSTWEHS